MSLSALTTAIVVAAAPVPGGAAPVPIAASGVGLVALNQTPAAGPPQASEPVPSTSAPAPAQPTDPAPSQPEIQLPPPPAGKGEIVVTGRRDSPDDPLEDLNSTAYEVTQQVDDKIVAPVAFAYKEIMPGPVRDGLRNFLHNLGEPIVFLNYLLQLKPGKAAETLGRFAINTAVGAAGIVDVAKRKPFNLPHRRNGFANTLGYYGVKPGPYFYLPLVGPTTLRDFIGNRLDMFVVPTIVGTQFAKPIIVLPMAVLSDLDHRIEFDDELRQIRATQDPYVAMRKYYLRKRQAEIDALHGRGDGKVPVVAPPSTAPAADNPPKAEAPAK